MLHHVGTNETRYSVTPESFARLARFLKQKNIIRLERWEDSKSFFALSFDDVPSDFYYNAFPILKQNEIPFTLFISVSLLGKTGYLSKDQLLEISHYEGSTIGSHGVRHEEYFPLSEEMVTRELKESKEYLEGILGKEVNLFAFPKGSIYACSRSNRRHVLDFYQYGFGTVGSFLTSPSLFPKSFLPRINVDERYIQKLPI